MHPPRRNFLRIEGGFWAREGGRAKKGKEAPRTNENTGKLLSPPTGKEGERRERRGLTNYQIAGSTHDKNIHANSQHAIVHATERT